MKEMLNIEAAIAIVELLSTKQNIANAATVNASNTIRQIAKAIKINHMTVTRTVKKLADMKAVSLQKVGPSYVVTLNKTSEVFGFLTLANSYKTGEIKKIKEKKGVNDVDQIIAKAKHAYEGIK